MADVSTIVSSFQTSTDGLSIEFFFETITVAQRAELKETEKNFTFKIYPPKATIPYILIININTGNIVQITSFTSPAGTSVGTFTSADFNDLDWTEANPIVLLNTYFGLAEDALMTDGVWKIDLQIDDVTLDTDSIYHQSDVELFTRNACCCKATKVAEITVDECECKDAKILQIASISAYLDSAEYAMCCNRPDDAQVIIDYVNQWLCTGECGCS